MSRPKSHRCLYFQPQITYFQPQGRSPNFSTVEIDPDELQALKLKNVDNLDQTIAALKMNISQPTYGRILDAAYKKLATALTSGQAIKLKTTAICSGRHPSSTRHT